MVKIIMRDYFENVGQLICCKHCNERSVLSGQILDLVLDVHGKVDLRPTCGNILRDTEMLQTVMDCGLFGARELPASDRSLCYLGMKAEYLRRYEVRFLVPFDRELLADTTARAALQGERPALRLGACLDWLDGNRDRAVRGWTYLAYAGERFAMRALEYALGQMGDGAGAHLWEEVRQICAEADARFSMTAAQCGQQPAVQTARLVLAVRNRCAELQQKTLPLSMLQYVIDSSDDLAAKVRNLYHPAEPYPVLLLNERGKKNCKFGF